MSSLTEPYRRALNELRAMKHAKSQTIQYQKSRISKMLLTTKTTASSPLCTTWKECEEVKLEIGKCLRVTTREVAE